MPMLFNRRISVAISLAILGASLVSYAQGNAVIPSPVIPKDSLSHAAVPATFASQSKDSLKKVLPQASPLVDSAAVKAQAKSAMIETHPFKDSTAHKDSSKSVLPISKASAIASKDSAINTTPVAVTHTPDSTIKPAATMLVAVKHDSLHAPDSTAKPADKGRDVIAVNNFDGKGIEQSDADLITEQIRSQIISQRRVGVMERSMMDQILKEQGFQQSGSCDGSDCQVQVGRILGVNNLVVGSIGRIGRIYMVNAKLVDVSTGEVLQSITETCEGSIEDVLRTTTFRVAEQITHMLIKSHSGILAVQSIPSGAEVRLGNARVGTTPYSDSLVEPGNYSLQVVHPDWNTETRQVSISKGITTSLRIQMERSPAWLAAEKKRQEDALAALQAQQREKERQELEAIATKKFHQRLALGIGGATVAGIGTYFHYLKGQEDNKANDAYAAYQQSMSQSDMDNYRSQTKTHQDNASTYKILRNVCWTAGGLLLASISLTYWF